MHNVKISNLYQGNGHCDYKGLDISQFIAGSQIYPSVGGYAVIKTMQVDIPAHDDIEIITEEQYNIEREAYLNSQPKSPEELIAEQGNEIALLWYELMMVGGAS